MGHLERYAYRNWIEGLDLGIALVSLDGKIRYANARFSEILGFGSHANLRGKNLKDYLFVSSTRDFLSALQRSDTGRVEGEIHVLNRDRFRIIKAYFDRMKANGHRKTVRVVISEITKAVETNITLKKYQASVESLSARILRLQDEERRRIARELHDTTGQDLAVLLIAMSQVAAWLERQKAPEGIRQTLTDAVVLARKAEDQIRNLSYVLHPPLLDELGLSAALRWYVEGFKKRTGIDVELLSRENPLRLAPERETALFRVVQESLSNILRHSGSKCARVRLAFLPGSAEVSIRDYGKGIPEEKLSEATKGKSLGVGIAGMRERLEQLGGSIEIRSSARGTLVIAKVPAEFRDGRTQLPAVSPAAEKSAVPANQAAKRILIVEDHEVTRHGIKALLENEPDLEICGEAEDGVQAVLKAAELHPHLVILDLSMPRAGGFSAIKQIRHTSPSSKILVFTTHASSYLLTTLQAASCDGYVTKGRASEDLLRGVRSVLAGQKFFSLETPLQQYTIPV